MVMDQFEKVRIKRTSQQLGLSPSVLRKYEQQGVTPALLRSDAKYRYYSSLDISRINTCRKYRGYGYEVKEAVELMNTASLAELKDSLQEKQIQFEAELRWKQLVLEEIQATLHDIEQFRENEGLFMYEELPAQLYVKTTPANEAMSKPLSQAVRRMTECIPLAKLTVFGVLEAGQCHIVNPGYSISKTHADQLGLQENGFILALPPQKCIVGYLCCRRDKEYLKQTIPAMQRFASSRGYAPTNNVIMHTIFSSGWEEETKGYRKVYVLLK